MVLRGSVTALTLTDSIRNSHAYNSYPRARLTKLITTILAYQDYKVLQCMRNHS